ncbi:Na+/H+-exchanging protein [Geminocystis sp. NIES-3708]|uniref:cation:proton antiporter n=1 Tax=Geminocystis sp. NIES-3708 TaxID=1615909 RepID=UPI0005FC6AEA|nr:cation:proton antiporter [Geminocystis sp. NIES-3708]BAQ62011.1 Na+/H+-exchanging protein [Geminocystis sp. NIES-3708]
MLESILWIILLGFFVSQVFSRAKIPALVGLIVVGIILGPQVSNVLASDVLNSAPSLRIIAVMVILMKAGLGLDTEKLAQQGTVALRLGFLPATFEAIAIAFAAMLILNFDFPTGLLLGCIIGAESPAVIVPAMLRLKSLGWGVNKGIPDAILTGSALSDVLLLLVFSLLMAFLGNSSVSFSFAGFSVSPLFLLPFQVVCQIGLGILMGWLTAHLLVSLLVKQNWTQNAVQDTFITAGFALLLVVLGEKMPIFSGYLAVMALGFFLIELDAPLARILRAGFDGLWEVAQIFLFVLLGASIQLNVLGNSLMTGLLILIIGTLIGRTLGWYLSTLGSNWTWGERLFLLPGNSAKATVQAAIGAIPLTQGIAGGDSILAIAVLSILVTAPLGAWAIPIFAPKLLEKGEVDPTKVTLNRQLRLLAAIDNSPLTNTVLLKVAELARRSNAEVIVLHVVEQDDPQILQYLEAQTQTLLADIRYRFITTVGVIPEEIVKVADYYKVVELIIGKRGHNHWENVLISSKSQTVLETSAIPVILVENQSVNFTVPPKLTTDS